MIRLGGFTLVVFAVLLFVSSASAVSYDIIVDEGGESLVLLSFNQSGTFEVKLPEDVEDVKVKGALYFFEDNILELSIGSTESAAVLYRTHALTSKQKEDWTFVMDVPTTGNAVLSLNLPSEVTVHSTEPKVFIDTTEFKRIAWEGDFSTISARFSYSDTALPEIDSVERNNDDVPMFHAVILVSGIVLLLLAVVAYFVSRRGTVKDGEGDGDSGTIKKSSMKDFNKKDSIKNKDTKKSNSDEELTNDEKESSEIQIVAKEHRGDVDKKDGKQSEAQKNIIKTLSRNEATIVTVMIEEDGSLKRNELERQTKIAKSSLASSLHNLEQKNILKLDKSRTVHFVELTEWFKEL